MPLFEYQCRACGHRFEYLTQHERQPECPACQSRDLQKQLSTFAVSTGGGKKAALEALGPCATCGDPCGAGSCAID